MLFPNILAGVEQSRQQPCVGVEAADIRPLVEVVIQAGQPQVFGDRRPVVSLGNDVVDLEGQNVERLRQPTVSEVPLKIVVVFSVAIGTPTLPWVAVIEFHLIDQT
jgi:hypothetical protein